MTAVVLTELDLFSAFYAGMDAYNDLLVAEDPEHAWGYVDQATARKHFVRWMDERGN